MKAIVLFWLQNIKRNKNQRYNVVLGLLLLFICIIIILNISSGSQVLLSLMEEENQVELEDDLPNDVQNTELIPGDLIRVLLKTDGFQQIVHTSLVVSAANGLTITYDGNTEEVAAGEQVTIAESDERFANGTILIEPLVDGEKITVHTLNRGYGTPSYYGVLEVYGAPGGMVLVNEVELELYVQGVLPSEMPSSYAIEALKAQAVCARSYGYNYMKTYHYTEYEAHVDDSTSYQVYNNSAETEITNQAVQETANQKLCLDGNVVTTYFFSTSCGYTTDVSAWGTQISTGNAYLTSIHVGDDTCDYEEDLPWYSWSITMSAETMKTILERNLSVALGTLQSVTVTQVGGGGVALELSVVGSEGSVVVSTENKIRKALGGTEYQIQKNDGNVVNGTSLLPSAFFNITYDGTNYVINGGGYGHGIGMSQNGANQMALAGANYVEILQTFYTGTEIVE